MIRVRQSLTRVRVGRRSCPEHRSGLAMQGRPPARFRAGIRPATTTAGQEGEQRERT
jgi:hypothetical protein